jgi:hypothetical protein
MAKNPTNPEYDGNECVAATDWLGNRFRVGEVVMYCVGAGRGQMMAIGRVLKIDYDATRPYDSFKIQVLTEKTSGNWNNEKRTRPAFVNPMNITAITQPTQ